MIVSQINFLEDCAVRPTILCNTLENDTNQMRYEKNAKESQALLHNSIRVAYNSILRINIYSMGRKNRRKQNETFLNIVLRWVRPTCYDIVIVHYKTSPMLCFIKL